MGSQELIQIIDTNILKQDVSTTLIEIGKIDEAIKKIAPYAIGGSTGSSAAFRQQSQQMVAAMQQIADMQKKLIDLEEQLQTARSKRPPAKNNDELKAQVEETLARQKNIAAIKDQIRLEQSQEGAINQRKIILKQLQAQYDSLGTSAENASKRSALLAQIQPLDEGLKKDVGDTGRHQSNVGDYVGALKTLESELVEVNKQIALMDKAKATSNVQNLTSNPIGFDPNRNKAAQNSDPQNRAGGSIGFDPARYKELNQQASALNVILNQQGKGFTSVTQEIRSSERALQTLRAAGLEGSEGFEKLRESTIEAAQAQKEFQRQQKLLEGEAPLLGALTLAAKGLAGAYAVGQGSIALFAEGNEKVEKELNKLVAILTILQGLREAYELIQQAGAVRLAVETALTKAATTVQAQFAGSIEETTAANTALAASQEEVIAETEVESAALGETTVAAEGATVAITETEVATTALSTTLLASGIGLAIVAIAGAIAYLISKIPDWIKGNELTIKQQNELAESIKKANDALIEQADFIDKLDGSTKRYYENQIALSSAAGQNEEKRFAFRKALTQAEKEGAQNTIDFLGADNAQQSRLAGTIDQLNLRRREAIKIQTELLNIPDQNKTGAQKDQQEAAAKNIDFYSKQIDSVKGLYEAGEKARKELFAANLKTDTEELEETKFNNEQRNKIIFESTKIQADYRKHQNEIVLNDERSTLAQRLAAMKSNAEQEKNILQAQLKYDQSDPGKSEADKLIARKQTAEKENVLNKQSLEDERKLRYDYYERDKEARLQITTELLNGQLAKNEEFLNNDRAAEQKTGEDLENYLKARTEALQSSYIEREAIINAAYLKERSDAQEQGKTFLEIEAIDEKHAEDLAKLKITYDKQVTDEGKKQLQDRLHQIEQFYQDEKRVIDKAAADKIQTASNKYVSGRQSFDGYNKDKAKAEFEERKKDLEAQQRELFNQQEAAAKTLREARSSGDTGLEVSAGNDLKNANDATAKNQIAQAENLANRKKELQDEALAKEKEYADVVIASTDLVKTAIDARYENELNYIDRLMARNNLLKGEEEDRIKTSTLSEQEKAAAIARIDAQTAQRNRQLAHEAAVLKHDQAITDKAFNVAEAAEKGVIMVLSQENPVSAGIAAAFTAIEIAKIAATPIPPVPAYALGTDNHPGGPFIAGEKGPELRIDPSGKTSLTPGVPTLMHGEKGMRIIPNNKLFANADMVNNVLLGQIFKQQAAQIQKDETANEIKELRAQNEAATHATISAIRKISVQTVINVDSKFPSYIDKRIRR